MDLVIMVAGTDRPAGELDSLARTLRVDGALRAVDVDTRTALPDGAMGPVTDALLVSFGSGGIGVAVLQTVVAWLRGNRPGVRLKVTRTDGSAVEVELTSARDPAEALDVLHAAEREPGSKK